MNMEIKDSKETNKAPRAKVVKVNAQSVLCLSGNESMYEKDYGDGGFEEED